MVISDLGLEAHPRPGAQHRSGQAIHVSTGLQIHCASLFMSQAYRSGLLGALDAAIKSTEIELSEEPERASESANPRVSRTVLDRLRNETRGVHERLEQRLDLLAPGLTLARYSRVLERFFDSGAVGNTARRPRLTIQPSSIRGAGRPTSGPTCSFSAMTSSA